MTTKLIGYFTLTMIELIVVPFQPTLSGSTREQD